MPRYAAFLRGVSPMNCSMPDLVRALEAAGFRDVKTLLSSGNATFEARAALNGALEEKAEAAMQAVLGRSFMTIVRPVAALRALLASDPYAGTQLPKEAKRVVTFFRAPPPPLALPIEKDGASIVALRGTELFSAYVASDKGPVFMALIERAVGREQTTRTWQTVEKAAR